MNTANAIVKDNSDSDQTQVDAAKKALEDAHKALEKRGDTDALKALVEKYKDLKEADYTHDTWVVFKEAFDAAKSNCGRQQRQHPGAGGCGKRGVGKMLIMH